MPVSGPSFLGLADEPDRDRDFHYLLDDEPRGHGFAYVLLLLIMGGAAFGAWHFRAELHPLWSSLWTRISDRISLNSGGAAPTPQSTAPPPSTEAPGAPHSATVTENEAAPQNPEAGPQNSEVAPQKDQQRASDTGITKPGQASDSSASSKEKTAAAKNSADTDADTEKDSSAEDESSDNAPPEKAAPVPVKKSVAVKPQPAPVESIDDRLAAEGERYLYGTGVPQNCDRARRNLTTAARASNPKAFTLLGAMYATGHCASRDLPTAYKWFARALHQDPANARVQRDLEVLWKQMTPDERQVAQRQ
jgi:Sel1 repeat